MRTNVFLPPRFLASPHKLTLALQPVSLSGRRAFFQRGNYFAEHRLLRSQSRSTSWAMRNVAALDCGFERASIPYRLRGRVCSSVSNFESKTTKGAEI